jgi:multimeric flavodoxin WrbA
VLGICGSPRNGNSLFLLEQALDACRQTAGAAVADTLYTLKGKKLEPCRACGACGKREGHCTHRDDFAELRALWMAADVILYSVPVYHMGLPAQLKAFLDRLGNSSFGAFRSALPDGISSLPKLAKVIGSIAQGMHMSAGQEQALTQLINHALVMQCIPVTGDLWESYVGAAGWTANDESPHALETMAAANLGARAVVAAARSLGTRCVQMAAVVGAGLAACHEMLVGDPLWKPLLLRKDVIA